uniref:ATP synthase F0 subunit 8 n=1 Tax=Hypnea cervicornis TaxID=387623 RepID=UPI0021B5DFB7|nr:ATP synthase F0 subunit 8 [Hypnea cervicornis]UVW80603.1 ATP synthase F0 subunit 8 [Hypnea cervicornis]WCH57961.1 ATP synthase F0 subunit 8 [Hypnea marchantiae]
MPQLDRVIIFSQIFWLFVIFSALYIILTHFFLPLFLKSIKLRKQIVEANSLEVSQLSEKVVHKQVLVKQKLLEKLAVIENLLSESYKFQKYFKNEQQITIIDEKISIATINYLLYCDSLVLNSILFYPKFFNFKV